MAPEQVDASSDASADGSSTAPGSDANAEPDANSLPEFEPDLWAFEPCEGVETLEPVSDEPFVMPDRPPDYEPRLNRDEVLALANGETGTITVPARDLQPGPGRPWDLFATPGTDVVLYFYIFSAFEDPQEFRPNLTVMVDYKPVDANWVRWNADRSEVILEHVGSGLRFGDQADVEIIDITLPASSFPKERAYEISLGMTSTEYSKMTRTASRRLVLYNGGYARPSRPCTHPPAELEWEPVEHELRNARAGGQVLLFPERVESHDQLRMREFHVEGGERINFLATQFRVSELPNVTVAQPVVNGEPFMPPFWLQQGGPDTHRLQWVDARFSFEYQVPEEPGVYEVLVQTWEDPYLTWRNLDGTRNRDVVAGLNARQNSNSVRLIVSE